LIYINAPPQQTHKQSSATSIPLSHVFTSCRVVASRRTRFVCLLVSLFVHLVGCCVVSLPLVVVSILSHHHATSFAASRLSSSLSSRCRQVAASSRHCVSSCLVVVLCTLTHLGTPTLFDCCIVALYLICPSPLTSPLVTQHRCRHPRCSSSAAAQHHHYLQWPPNTPYQTPSRHRHLPKPPLHHHDYLIVA
jgi:hypothetical protein